MDLKKQMITHNGALSKDRTNTTAEGTSLRTPLVANVLEKILAPYLK